MWRAILAQTTVELRLTARRGENLVAMLAVPAGLLLFLGSTRVLPEPATGTRVDALLPGILALAIVATGLVNLGIATAYERSYGVLKRLGGSPLGRPGLIAAKVLAIVVIELGLVVLLAGLAAGVLGWRPPGPVLLPLLVVSVMLGTATFAGFGLAMAGTLRAEATLVFANVLFLLVMAVGGVLVPVTDLPGPMARVAGLFPSAALAEGLRAGLGGTGGAAEGFDSTTGSLAILAAWALIAGVLAVRTFRWD